MMPKSTSRYVARTVLCLFSLLAVWSSTDAAPITYSSHSAFTASIGSSIVDTFSNSGYTSGDVQDGPDFDWFYNAGMSAVLGQTDYFATGYGDGANLVDQTGGNPFYCGGCDGSFLMTFTSTTVGTATGVYGAGFSIRASSNPTLQPTYAHITFGDLTTANYLMLSGQFFGVTNDALIQSIHIGGLGGAATTDMYFEMDDLEIGASPSAGSPIPEPTSLLLLSSALAGVITSRCRRQHK